MLQRELFASFPAIFIRGLASERMEDIPFCVWSRTPANDEMHFGVTFLPLNNLLMSIFADRIDSGVGLIFLRKIRDNEKLSLTDSNLIAIQRQFHSDIRSMINYIQTNQEHLQELHVITNSVWEKLVDLFRDSACDIATIKTYFREIGERYYIDPRTIIKHFMYYIVRHRSDEMVSVSLLNSIEHIIHLHHIRNEYIIHYFILKIRAYFQRLAPQCVDVPPSIPKGKRVIKVKKTKTVAKTKTTTTTAAEAAADDI